MHINQSCFKFYLSLLIISLLMFINSACTSSEESEPIRYTVAGKKVPKDSLKDQSSREVYHLNVSCQEMTLLNVSYYDMTLSPKGQLSVTEQEGERYTITVFEDTSLSLRAVEYITLEKDLILLCQLQESREDNWSEISRINPGKRKVKWNIRFGSFNLSPAAIQGRYLYGSTIGYVCKIDLKKGKIVWEHDDLYEEYQVNYFKKILFFKDTVCFLGKVYFQSDGKTMSGRTERFKYNKRSGEMFED